MRAILILFLLFAPHLTAYWNYDRSATISWHQETRGCLYRNTTFIACYEQAGDYAITFGRVGPLDAAYRPAAHDTYTIWTPDGIERAPLAGRPMYLPLIKS